MTTTKIPRPPRVMPPIRPMYVILGMINEYHGGRFISEEDHIENFDSNESACAARFKDYLRQVAQEAQIPAKVTEQVSENGRRSFASPTLAPLINEYYEFSSRTIPLVSHTDPTDTGSVTIHYGTLRMEIFQPHPLNRRDPEGHSIRLSYLQGVYLREGKGITITFGNAQHKAELVTKLLKEVGCSYVAWAYEGNSIPNIHTITFRPTWELAVLCDLPVPPEDD